jgi:FGGY-family pentulose kinase
MFVGVDVGSSNARAGIFTSKGELIGLGISGFQVYNPKPDFYEHNSDEIWSAVCRAVASALEESKISPDKILGIGFDATCSLVVLDHTKHPITLERGNVIMWMDHRAHKQAEILSNTGHSVLKQMGGMVNSEMSLAKVMWLYGEKIYDTIGHLIELPEFLTWKATGSMRRSLCSIVCKWGYDCTVENGIHKDFLRSIINEEDIPELLIKCGFDLAPLQAGCCVGNLSEKAAKELGLTTNCLVGYPTIDAYAGAVGTIMASDATPTTPPELSTRMALICGTSSCHILFTKLPLYVNGVWGPYPNVAIPGWFCTEGGQSLTGKAIEVMIQHHPDYIEFSSHCEKQNIGMFDELNNKVLERSNSKDPLASLTKDIHVLPDFHGNRSPISDPSIRGSIVGLSIKHPLELHYYAVLLALCYGTKHILQSLKTQPSDILISGGMSANSLWLQSLADITGCRVFVPKVDPDASVLLGSAIFARAARGDLASAMIEMSNVGLVISPNQNATISAFHNQKYNVFLELYKDQLKYRQMMK